MNEDRDLLAVMKSIRIVIVAAFVLGIAILVIYLNQKGNQYMDDGQRVLNQTCQHEREAWGHAISDYCKKGA